MPLITFQFPCAVWDQSYTLLHINILDKAEKTTCSETVGRNNKSSDSYFVANKPENLREPHTLRWTAGATLASKSSHTDSIRKEVLFILNKLTAENFEQQGEKFLSLDITSASLHVIAQLIYQKAIYESKFTSLYAQLCLKLCSRVPNFETKGSQSCCEDEFKTRDVGDDQISRQKCLGNLRFIAELGICGVMSEKVLHNCVQELLSRKGQHTSVNDSEVHTSAQEKNKSANTLRDRSSSTDLEYLCQFLTAVGKHMDTPKAKNLMDQYFHRLRRILSRAYDSDGLTSNKLENISTGGKISRCSKSNDSCNLPTRVRFMIEDLIDLRENNWVPRRAGQRTETNKPRFLRDIRLEILKESGVLVAPTPSERSITQPDVPGSAFVGHSSASSNSSVNGEFPFVSGLSSSSSKNNNGLNTGEAKSWMKLARMGEELCRQSPRDFCLLDNRNRIGESSINQFYGRPSAGTATANRRFLSSKNDLSHSNNIPHQGSKPNTTDGWTKKTEKIEVSNDMGWVRGVNPRLRNSVITLSNGISTTNSNLPPRMLRKLAAEAAGNLQINSTSNVLDDTKQPIHLEAQSFHEKSTSDNTASTSKSSPFNTTSYIHPLGQANSSDPFEPAYLQREKSSVSNGDKVSIQKPVWFNPKGVSNTGIYGSSHPSLSGKPQSSSSCPSSLISKPNFPDIQTLTLQKSCNRKVDQLRSSNSNNVIQLSNNVAENNYTTHVVDENKKIALRLLNLLGDSRDPILVRNQLNSSDFSRITTEVLAIAVLHLCEEGTNLKLAEAEPYELATLFVACAENLLHRDATTSFFTSKDNRKVKSAKLSCHPLSLVWSHLLNKVLCTTQLTYSKSKLALLSAALIWSRHISLSEFGEPLRGGKHHPLFLLVLQRLSQIVGEDFKSDESDTIRIAGVGSGDRFSSLIQLFQESELQMNQMVPEGSQTNEALLSLLEERNLDFLVPSLRLSTELSHLIMDTSSLEGMSPEESDKVIASKFSDYLSQHPIHTGIQASDYIHACLPVIYEYIYTVGIVNLGSFSSPATLMAREKVAWECIVPQPLIEMLRNSTDRQLDALHDLQFFWVGKNMPKGFLFRCFMNLYNCELVCEDAFLSWKEEVNPSYPAKGQALFEVNRWLTWLETAEEEDEEDRSKSDSNDDHGKKDQECSVDSENSEASKSPDHFIGVESNIVPPVLCPSSAALLS
ncbi:unnamed protein product [Schistosoma turkestanicum]|nr:unnamed protein product [Schistosoma turkestanicum]